MFKANKLDQRLYEINQLFQTNEHENDSFKPDFTGMSIENQVRKFKNVTLLQKIVFRMIKRFIMQTRVQSEHKATTQNERKPTISVCKWKTPGVSPLPPNKRHKCRLTGNPAHLRRYNFNAGLLGGGQIPCSRPRFCSC